MPATDLSMDELDVRTEPLGGSPLARAAMTGRTPLAWYGERPVDAPAWSARLEAIRSAHFDGAWWDQLSEAIGPSGAAAERLDRVRNGRGVLITTGQQPGLFGGPVYTWSKAIGALALADELERVTGIPTAPLFWAATDDADHAEASWTAVALPGGPRRLQGPLAGQQGAPMSHMPLGDVSEQLAELERAAGGAVDPSVLARVRRAYRDGATVGGAYLALLRELLAPLGVPVLDASHPATARCSRPILLEALRRADSVTAALHAREQELAAAGFEPQVKEVAGLSLVFERSATAKVRVPLARAASVADGATDLVLSPNVLLRPVVERWMLPTAAYVAGPGELSYFAQSSAVADALGVPAPLAVPRWSTTIVEPHVRRALDALALTPDDLRDPHAAEGRLARLAMPADARDALGSLREALERGTDRARHALADDAALVEPPVLEGLRRDVGHRLDRLERRVVAAVKRREHEAMTRVATVRGALHPFGTRQERTLNFMPMLARHGRALFDRMLERAAEWASSLVARGESVAVPLEVAASDALAD
jgi:uncharacterized protein YllA (UPF0747 family)